ncbi:hypothetical protein ACHAWX_000796 [Stephanocyclus meneghinianus]
MKTSAAFIIAAFAGTANAFVPPQIATKSSSTSLYSNTATQGRVSQVKSSINKATKDTFASMLTEIEPFLTTEAGNSIYRKSMNRLKAKAKIFGGTLPEGYAKEAKCTEKRREKQNAYCQAKAAEAAAAAEAEAAAAAEAEAAAAAAAEEAAPAAE